MYSSITFCRDVYFAKPKNNKTITIVSKAKYYAQKSSFFISRKQAFEVLSWQFVFSFLSEITLFPSNKFIAVTGVHRSNHDVHGRVTKTKTDEIIYE